MILNIQNDDPKRAYLDAETYQAARSERLRIDNYTCQCCGSKRDLEVHHINRENNDAPDARKDLITLCRSCHERIEATIREKKLLAGDYYFTIVSCYTEHFPGSDKMQECERVKIKILAYDNGSREAKYIVDNLPLLEIFAWKWRQLLISVQMDTQTIDSETIASSLIGRIGKAQIAIRNGEIGEYNCVARYLPNMSFDYSVPFDI